MKDCTAPRADGYVCGVLLALYVSCVAAQLYGSSYPDMYLNLDGCQAIIMQLVNIKAESFDCRLFDWTYHYSLASGKSACLQMMLLQHCISHSPCFMRGTELERVRVDWESNKLWHLRPTGDLGKRVDR